MPLTRHVLLLLSRYIVVSVRICRRVIRVLSETFSSCPDRGYDYMTVDKLLTKNKKRKKQGTKTSAEIFTKNLLLFLGWIIN